MTSVKEFLVEREATTDAVGRGRFVFTDDYSVFDWGAMPDTIPQKGASLCTMGAANFELLSVDVPTHYRGVVPPGADEPVSLAEIEEPPREMAIDLVTAPPLPYVGDDSGDGSTAPTADSTAPANSPGVVNGYDYGAYYETVGDNYLIPLEIVFRNTVPVGSSLRRRRTPGEIGLDYDEWPDEPVGLPEPVVEFSSKFEQQDRYLSREAADQLAGPADVERLAELARTVNRVVTERAEQAGLAHDDGKIECFYADGAVGVADVVGTLDENRFTVDGVQFSKEILRQHYKRRHSSWVEAVSEAKRRAAAEDVADWRPLCESPPALAEEVIGVVSDAYAAAANAYVTAEPALADSVFEAPSVTAAARAVREL